MNLEQFVVDGYELIPPRLRGIIKPERKVMKNIDLWKSTSNAKEASFTNVGDVEMVSVPVEHGNEKYELTAIEFLADEGVVRTPTNRGTYDELLGQVNTDLQLIEMIGSKGSDLSVRTDVEHWAYFRSSFSASHFTQTLLSKGFQVREVYKNNDMQTVVKFAHAGNLELPDIGKKTIWLTIQASTFKGRYDGWEVTTDALGNLRKLTN
jgi:hypothetical protein